MNLGLIALHLGLATVAFLIVLNGYLRGAAKAEADLWLGFILVGLLVVAFITFGGWAGLVAVGAFFVYGTVLRPLAKRLAYRILGYKTVPPHEENTLLKDFAEGRIDFAEFQVKRALQEDERQKRLQRLSRRPEIQEVLAKHGKSLDELEEYLQLLQAAGLGAVVWEYLSDPDDLDVIIGLHEEGKEGSEILAELIEPLGGAH